MDAIGNLELILRHAKSETTKGRHLVCGRNGRQLGVALRSQGRAPSILSCKLVQRDGGWELVGKWQSSSEASLLNAISRIVVWMFRGVLGVFVIAPLYLLTTGKFPAPAALTLVAMTSAVWAFLEAREFPKTRRPTRANDVELLETLATVLTPGADEGTEALPVPDMAVAADAKPTTF